MIKCKLEFIKMQLIIAFAFVISVVIRGFRVRRTPPQLCPPSTPSLLARYYTPQSSNDKRSNARVRIDEILVELMGINLKEASSLIFTGKVLFGEGRERINSPAFLLRRTDVNKVIVNNKNDLKFVSRAGLKLDHVVQKFPFEFASRITSSSVAIDIGASTGGFTDVLLQRGCGLVYAVDVGQSLLDWKIRSDPRVVVVEKTNARYLNSSHIPHAGAIDVVVCDVSFISLRKVLLPSLSMCKTENGTVSVLCALIKPQFECAKAEIGEGGIVLDNAVRRRVVDGTLAWFAQECPAWRLVAVEPSPITGAHGNIEYLMLAEKVEG